MALKKCKECGKDVSSTAKLCPHCGKKNPSGGLSLPLKIVLVIIGIIVVGWFYNEKDRSRNERAKKSAEEAIKIIKEMKESKDNIVGIDKQSVISSFIFNYEIEHKGSINMIIGKFTIMNHSEYDIKDLRITCSETANSGTIINRQTGIIYDILPAQTQKIFLDVKIGLGHSQAVSTSCVCTDFEFVNKF